MKKALITGINGQDGACLAALLLQKGYSVHGTIRCNESSLDRLDYLNIEKRVHIRLCDLSDSVQIKKVITSIGPDEIYNLAAQSSVGKSFQDPQSTFDFNLNSVSHILETVRTTNPRIKFYQASSSEMFGQVEELPITEALRFNPISPYAASKAAAHWMTKIYRQSYGMFCCSGILFNHESFLRGQEFVTKKIVSTAVRIKNGSDEKLKLGNVSIKRDWGFAPKYVEAMWLMMQQNEPDDFIIASGKTHSLEEFMASVFEQLNLNWQDHVTTDQSLLRPDDIDITYGDPSFAKEKLGWEYDWTLDQLTKQLVKEELANAK